jgi:hypothetical protein
VVSLKKNNHKEHKEHKDFSAVPVGIQASACFIAKKPAPDKLKLELQLYGDPREPLSKTFARNAARR